LPALLSYQKSTINNQKFGGSVEELQEWSLTDRARPATDWLLILGFCGFLFFFGLNYFGLIGADEPRYAQIAREMLAHHDWITPILGGKPWLEKPVLYYWQAMLSYSIFGVSDWAARIPSGLDATLAVLAVYGFLGRFRPGFQTDGALMTASTAGFVGFSRAASTDMPLAAMFSIGMLAWYAWHESQKRIFLIGFYAFMALAALAKGPVGPVLAGLIILLFALVRRDHRVIIRTLWIPGILVFCVIALPWYIAVQVRNPSFFRQFILEHNLARFGTNLYHHQQPFWYYAPVTLLALLPWTIFIVEAVTENVRTWWSKGKSFVESEDSLNLFLILWLFVPVLFFSLSQSKLPGYILPVLPAGTILLAQYLRRHIVEEIPPPYLVPVLHSVAAAAPLVPALLIQFFLLQQRLPGGTPLIFASTLAGIIAIGLLLTLRSSLGLGMLRFVTLVPVVLVVAAVLKIGGAKLDETLTARPLATDIARVEAGLLPAAVFQVPREVEYGLAFYRNQAISNYGRGEIPSSAHLVVAPEGKQVQVAEAVHGRRASLLGTYPPQHLDYYWVAAAGTQASEHHHH
jgi:4-amino-4-deoxy-L-arabinose transferase-like glycosyltransferase